jgi:hypothetical protein
MHLALAASVLGGCGWGYFFPSVGMHRPWCGLTSGQIWGGDACLLVGLHLPAALFLLGGVGAGAFSFIYIVNECICQMELHLVWLPRSCVPTQAWGCPAGFSYLFKQYLKERPSATVLTGSGTGRFPARRPLSALQAGPLARDFAVCALEFSFILLVLKKFPNFWCQVFKKICINLSMFLALR